MVQIIVINDLLGKKNFFCFHYNKGRSKMLSPSYKKIKSVTEHLLNKF